MCNVHKRNKEENVFKVFIHNLQAFLFTRHERTRWKRKLMLRAEMSQQSKHPRSESLAWHVIYAKLKYFSLTKHQSRRVAFCLRHHTLAFIRSTPEHRFNLILPELQCFWFQHLTSIVWDLFDPLSAFRLMFHNVSNVISAFDFAYVFTCTCEKVI